MKNDFERVHAVDASRIAEQNVMQRKPVEARIASTTATGKPIESGQVRFPSRSDGVAGWDRRTV